MKLLKVLPVALLGTLFVVGCTITTTDSGSDGGTDGGTAADSGTSTDTGAKADSGSTPTDTGSTPTDAGNPCKTCGDAKCSAEYAECGKPDNVKGCNDLITCISKCADTTCANKCISDSTSVAGKAFIGCLNDNCNTECFGP